MTKGGPGTVIMELGHWKYDADGLLGPKYIMLVDEQHLGVCMYIRTYIHAYIHTYMCYILVLPSYTYFLICYLPSIPLNPDLLYPYTLLRTP